MGIIKKIKGEGLNRKKDGLRKKKERIKERVKKY